MSNAPQIIADRLAKLNELVLGSGSHANFEKGVCALEAAAYLAGEPHSASPSCVDEVITSVLVNWNDSLPDDEHRNRLIRPLLVKIIGTRISKTDAKKHDSVLLKRMYLIQDWHVRVRAPAFLRLAGLEKDAAALEACGQVVDAATLQATTEAATAAESAARSAAESAAWSAAESAAESAARSAARSAAESAARSAAESAASSAARSAAESAAWSAARSAAESAAESAARSAAWSAAESAAWSAAESAARSAARSAAWSAAESAAESALKPTIDELHTSFVKVIEAMCAVTE